MFVLQFEIGLSGFNWGGTAGCTPSIQKTIVLNICPFHRVSPLHFTLNVSVRVFSLHKSQLSFPQHGWPVLTQAGTM